jgi:hypothetical protein
MICDRIYAGDFMNKSMIERALKCYEFESYNIDPSKVQHVPMGQFKSSTEDKPLLLVENLQVCVGLYAVTQSSSFASHIHTIDNKEFYYDEKAKELKTKKIDALYEWISNNYNKEIEEEVLIGIVLGCIPLKEAHFALKSIRNHMHTILNKLDRKNITPQSKTF